MKDNIFERVLELYEKEISKNVKSKRKVYNFEKYKMQNISEIVKAIDNNNFKINKYNIFLITEPKHRIVMSLNVKDKIINHYVARYVLETNLTKYLSSKNVATRKEMGADYGIKLIKKYLELNKNIIIFML